MEQFVAIDNVCAWPNLTRLGDGSIIATIFNQPTHGAWEGDVECWGSEDNGRSWSLRGTPAPHEPGTNRMNVAAGTAKNGDLIVIASGWADRPPQGQAKSHPKADVDSCLHAWVSRSSDGGRTWSIDKTTFPERPSAEEYRFIPFGDLLVGDDGILGVSAYTSSATDRDDNWNGAYFMRSSDDGKTWDEPAVIEARDHNETTPLHLGGGEWIVASRTWKDAHLDLLRSTDNGATWQFDQPISLPSQHPAHLLRLADGRVLLTYGCRCPGHFGIHVRFGDEHGRKWSAPRALITFPPVDCGYPSSLQNEDGTITTAYYAGNEPHHQRYHMSTLIWSIE